jgi:RNA polymerase sigma-70 factor (ECF subfamily)
LQTQNDNARTVDVKEIVAPPTQVSDETILQKIRAGDISAYGSLMRRYNQRMFRIARSIVIDDSAALDAVQEANIKAYFRLAEYRGDSGYAAWLAGITRNEALMILRKHKREVLMPPHDMQSLEQNETENKPPPMHDAPDTLLENSQLKGLINQNIDKLPMDFRSVFVCRAIEQFSVKETAGILDIKQETVKTRFFRARRLLRGYLQSYLDSAGLKVYEVGGLHCDLIVFNVLSEIQRPR